jgi:hypothetical protein
MRDHIGAMTGHFNNGKAHHTTPTLTKAPPFKDCACKKESTISANQTRAAKPASHTGSKSIHFVLPN